jgi:hypothetical protein
MSEVEQYKKRSAGMNAMENAGAFAVTYWSINDIHAIKGRNKVSDEEAEELLERIDNRLHERMVEAGWEMVNQEFAEFIAERDE